MGTSETVHQRSLYTFLDAIGALGGSLGGITLIFGLIFIPLSTYQFYLIAYSITFERGKIVESLAPNRLDLLLLLWANLVSTLIPWPSISRTCYSRRTHKLKERYEMAQSLVNQKLDVISILKDN